MGNAQQAGYNRDQNQSIQAIKGWPLLFHQTHSTNIQLNSDQRRAKRLETFCNGICFSNRPVSIGEQVILRFAEVSSSWSGVLRFGFTSHDPTTINASTLPRYACPDLTNKYGYWAKALPERFALQGNILCFHVCRSGNVMYTVNGEDKGLFFGGVMTGQPLWALIDIYGNTTSIEFIDPRLILSLPLKDSSSSPTLTSGGSNFFLPTDSQQQLNNSTQARPPVPLAHHQSLGHAPSQALLEHRANNQNLHQYNYRQQQHKLCSTGGRSSNHSSSLPDMTLTPVSAPPPVRHHKNLTTLQFHSIAGKNVQLSSEGTVAARLTDEYCNGYVFSSRPVKPGEKIVVQVLLLDNVFTGGIAFGMTSCDISTLTPSDLPDDADLLLDRPEYWVVNKDVCSNAVVGDELSFYFTVEGEIKYGRNGLHMSTLMHVDKEVKLWAFFDIYGQTQKIKLLGVTTPSSSSLPTTGNPHGRPTQQSDSTDGPFQNLPDFLATELPMSGPYVFSLPLLIDTSTDGDVPPPRPPPPVKKATNHPSGQSHIPALPPKQSRPAAGTSDASSAVPQLLTPTRVATENGGIASQRQQDQVAVPRPIVSSTPRYVFSPPLSAPSNPSSVGHRMFQIPSKSDSLRLKSSPLAPAVAPKPGTPLRGSATFRFSRPLDAADVSSTSLPFQTREGRVASHNRSGIPQFIPDLATPTPVPRTTIAGHNSRSEINHHQQGSQQSPAVFQSSTNSSEPKENFLGECSVCLERAPDCALYMCGHMCMCYDCAIALKESRDAQCPICRQPIKDIIKIYRS